MRSAFSLDGSPLPAIAVAVAAIACCSAPSIAAALAAGVVPVFIAAHRTLLGVLAAILFIILSLVAWSRAHRQNAFAIVRDALRTAFSGAAARRSVALLAVVGAPLTLFYLVALPAERFGALAWGALQFLTAGDGLAAALIGFGVPLSVALNLAARKARTAQTTLTLGGVVAALLPSSLCCTTLIPSALAALGASAPAVMHLSGRFQGFFADYAAVFIAFAVAAVLFSLWLAASNLAAGCTTCTPIEEFERP